MRIWIISDTHIGHRNIAKYCGRPHNHEELMWAALEALVGPQDVLIHCGDVAPFAKAKFARETVDALPGDRKILIEGNHDKNKVRAYESSNPHWKGKGWSSVVRKDMQPWTMHIMLMAKPLMEWVCGPLEERTAIPRLDVVFSHRPLKDEDIPKRSLVIHGHIHDIGPRERWVGGTKIINACVEQNGYAPFELYAEARSYLKERSQVQL